MLVSLGLDFRRARLEVRERFHLEDDDVPRVFDALARRGVREAVIARTCNRVEAYCWWPDGGADAARGISRAWVGGDGSDAEALRSSATLRRDTEVPAHLFRVAAGLESQILGDIHILGQLRRAFRDALAAQAVGSNLHRLFETAFRVGKQVKRETRLMASRSSVGSEAARCAAAHWGRLAEQPCVVVGCGKSGTHAARALVALGARDLTVVNRTVERAEKLAAELGGVHAGGFDILPATLARAAVVIVATGAPQPVLTREFMARARGASPPTTLVVDVSVPRNVETAVGKLQGVSLVDLDSLHPTAAAVEKSRLEAIPAAETLVDEAILEFSRWLELRDARRALVPLHEVLSDICMREVSHLAGESAGARRTADRIVARVMARPMTALRAASERGEPLEDAAGALGVLFEATRTGT